MTCVECGQPGLLKDHPECGRRRKARQQREYRRADGSKNAARSRWRKSAAESLGLTIEEFEELCECPCDICGSARTERRLNSPYHRRDTGTVTGVVCQRCVTALGYLQHDPERVRRALHLLTSDIDVRGSSE